MKIHPKNARFCPGCPKKELKLQSAPQFVFSQPQVQDTRTVTVIGAKQGSSKPKIFGLF